MWDTKLDRRLLLQLGSTAAASGLVAERYVAANQASGTQQPEETTNMIGAYGPWAANIVGDEIPRLSFRRNEFQDLEDCALEREIGFSNACFRPPNLSQATFVLNRQNT